MTPGTQSPCQTQKMQIPHYLRGIPRRYHYTRGSSHGPKESPGYPTMASTEESEGTPIIPRLCQLLLTIHRQLLWDHKTPQ